MAVLSFLFFFVLERLVPVHQTTRRHIAEESTLNVLVSLTTVVSKQGCTYCTSLGGGGVRDFDMFKQDRKCTYNVPLRRVRATRVRVEKQ